MSACEAVSSFAKKVTSGMLPNRQHSKPKILSLERCRKKFILDFDLWKAAELSFVLEYCLLKGAEILKPRKNINAVKKVTK